MQTLLQDLRSGARMLLNMPGFSLIALLTLSLGITADMTLIRAEMSTHANYSRSQNYPIRSIAHAWLRSRVK